MKSILTKKVLFLALVAVTVFATGCIKEDLDECYKLTLKVVNHKGDDITALSVVSEAKLFIYDNNSKLLDTRDLNDAFISGKETIELNYPESSKLHLIAWGNLKGHQDVNEATKAEDHRRFELAQSRNQADAAVAQIRKTLKDLGDKVDGADRAACESAIKDVEAATKGEDKAAIDKSVEALMSAAQKIGEKMNAAAKAGEAQAQQQASQGAEQAQSGAKKPEADVVDADYKEVKH